jgi:mannose-6-phosphate isomerase-like protein (cupin superfamily)
VKVRRVVTIDDGDGHGVVASDGEPAMFGGADSAEGVDIGVVWAITDTPPDLASGIDAEHPAWNLGPIPLGCARWSMLTFHPGARARGMHRTQTIDFVQIISGEIDLVLGGGEEVRLGPGDAVVQRGATHAWENRGDQPCVMSAIMLTAR